MRVEAHVHIGKARKGEKDCVSVRTLPTGHVRYSSTLHLTDVSFAVQPAGLRKFRETGQKNVHAFVRGNVQSERTNWLKSTLSADWEKAGYNPNKVDSFMVGATPITSADEAILIGKDLFVKGYK